jgi:hypothetical protein
LNRIKNDSTIFEHPQDSSSLDSERRFGKEKVVCSLVPHSWTPEQKEDQVTSCQDSTVMADADKIFFNKIIKGDENWCFAYEPERK